MSKQSKASDAKGANSTALMPFPIEAFPSIYQAIIKNLQESSNFHPDHCSTMLLSVASTLIGDTVRCQVRRSWKQLPIFWGAIVADSGSLKSPIINFFTKPILDLEEKMEADFVYKLAEWEEDKANYAKERVAFTKAEPPRKDIIVKSTTIEALFSAFQRNSRGVIMLQDELAGWMNSMNAYRAGSDIEDWLSLHDGNFIKTNRQKAQAGFKRHTFISVAGGIQPSKLKALAKGGRDRDGTLFRVMFSYPDNERVYPLSSMDMDQQTQDVYERLMLKIYDKLTYRMSYDAIHLKDNLADSSGTNIIPLSEKANAAFLKWNTKITDEINNNLEDSVFRSIIKKIESSIIRVAIILEVLRWADSANPLGLIFSEISEASIKGAIMIGEYYKATAFKVQRILETDDDAIARNDNRIGVKWDIVFGENEKMRLNEITKQVKALYKRSESTTRRLLDKSVALKELEKIEGGEQGWYRLL
jgi:hypothetical protein